MSKLIGKYVYVSYIVQAINVIVNFIYSLIIVHQLGASGYGDYAVFYNSVAFAVLLFGFNLPSIIVFFITNNRIDPGKLLFSSFVFTFFTTLCLALFLYQSGRLGFAMHIFPGGDNKPIWIFLFTAQFFLLQTNQVLGAFLNANKIFIPVAVFSLLCNMTLLLFWTFVTFHLLIIKAPLFNLVWWVSLLINFCITGYSIYLIFTKTIIHSFRKLTGFAELRILAGFAVIVYLCNTLQFLNYKMDIWFVNYFHGKEDTGVYALALSLSQLIWVLPNAISAVLLNYFQVNQKEYSIYLAVNYARVSFYFSLLTAIALSVIYYFALPYLYGAQFYSTFRLCVILFIGTVPFSLSIIIANLNSGIGFIRINLYATIFTFLLGFILDFALIPDFGIRGAAIAKVIIYIIGLIFQILVGNVLYKLHWLSMFRFPQFKNIGNSYLKK